MSWADAMRARLEGQRDWLVPDWPAHERVRAFVTTRAGGVSKGEYATMNLGTSSGDELADVSRNREIVRAVLPSNPVWLAQVHGTDVFRLEDSKAEGDRSRADAAVTAQPRLVCTVLTADCMPLFLSDRQGRAVAVAHAGWRGLAAGVIENTFRALGSTAGDTLAWMGPAIGPRAFEVGPEVREALLSKDSGADAGFVSHGPGKYLADLYVLARRRLEALGIGAVFGGDFCTFTESQRFFSYRREKQSGRMGAFIWID